jgi:hypothetical protein
VYGIRERRLRSLTMAIMPDLEKGKSQKCRIFVLGAGFSAAAGIPMTASVLDQAMRLFNLQCAGVFERVKNYTQIAFGLGETQPDYGNLPLSDLCTFLDYAELRESGGKERWSNQGSRERLALKHYLAKAIVQNTPESDSIPDLYRAFASQLRGSDIVITFNWDCLLEEALTATGKLYTYGAEDDRILLCKMHGSVHWRLGNRGALYPLRLTWRPTKLVGVNESGLYHSDDLLRRRAWSEAQPIGGEVEPFLVLPGYGKAKDVHSVRWLWYKPEGFFLLAQHLYIIGMSLAPDDFFVRSFLLSALTDWQGRVSVINPDPAARANYSFLPGNNLSYRMEKFSLSHVTDMSSES